jgi:hypothetical protein
MMKTFPKNFRRDNNLKQVRESLEKQDDRLHAFLCESVVVGNSITTANMDHITLEHNRQLTAFALGFELARRLGQG